jgi:dihydroorotate dehydrogenase
VIVVASAGRVAGVPGPYELLVRPLLFRLDPERAHELAIGALHLASPAIGRLARPPDGGGRLSQELMGLRFANPIGLAAGFDKRARAVPAWPALGFGFAEVGTITAHPQPGNPRPRIHRLPEDRALVNRLGFNNGGAEEAWRTLEGWRRRGLLGRAPLGVNLGKSKVTPAGEAPADYARSLRLLWAFADYVVVNVSSPNTPGLRDLQEAGPLAAILDALDEVAAERLSGRAGTAPPVLVKLAPDLEGGQIDAVVDLARARGLAGVVVTNTTLARDGLASPPELVAREGGLSGAPLRARATEVVRRVASRAGGDLVVIGVGGVFTADDAWEKLAAGASLVQVYTGFVYGGPHTPRAIASGLLARMDREGVGSVAEIVGSVLHQ